MEFNQKKICFITQGYNRGGLETYILRLVEYSRPKSLTIFSKRDREGELTNSLVDLGVNLESIRIRNFSILGRLKFLFWLRKNRFESIVDFTGEIAGIELFIAKLVGIKNRYVFYRNSRPTYVPTLLNSILSKILRKMIEYNSTKILSNSLEGMKYYHRKYYLKHSSNCYIIYNGVSPFKTSKILGYSCRKKHEIGNRFLVGNVARYSHQKNHKTMFAVCDKLFTRNNKLEFIFIGRGVKEKFETRISQIKSSPIFTGHVDCLDEYYSAIDLFMFVSTIEGMPNALVEAILANIPCIISDIPAHRELLPDSHHQHLVDPNDIESIEFQILYWESGNELYDTNELAHIVSHKCKPESTFNKFLDIL